MINQLASVVGASQLAAVAGHKYWRLDFLRGVVSSNAYIYLQEVELRGTIGGSDLASTHTSATSGTGTVTHQFSGNSNTPGWKLFDDTDTTEYYSAFTTKSDPSSWVKYNFNTPANIIQYTIKSGRNSSAATANSPLAWTLEWSDDNSSWTVAHTVTNQTGWVNNQTRTYTI